MFLKLMEKYGWGMTKFVTVSHRIINLRYNKLLSAFIVVKS